MGCDAAHAGAPEQISWEHHCLRRYLEKTGLLGCFLPSPCAVNNSEVHGPLPGPMVSSWASP